MKSLRVRLTLWFTLGFVALAAIFFFATYRYLDLRLRRDTFQRDQKLNPNWILGGSYSEEEVQEIMGQLVQSSLIVALPLVLVILVLGYFIARQSLRPIESLNRQLQSISPRTLGQQVELSEGDEQFRSLLRHLNDMLARLEGSFTEMSEYAAKVSHELRTPLTIIRHKVEQSQGKIEPELAEDLQEELLRLTHVVDQSLLIAKAGQRRLAWKVEAFDLSAVLTDVVKDFDLLATADNRKLELRAEPGCRVATDARYCRQILHALLTNALIHGRDEIKIRLIQRGGRVRLTMANSLRASPTRSELTLGLGLRVVKALVSQQPALRFRQHHGTRLHAAGLAFPAAAAEEEWKVATPLSASPAGSKMKA
jgi:signal transduction histidine kinase